MKKILLALAALQAILVAYAAPQDFTPARKLQATQQVIENLYVDSVPSEKMVDAAIVAMLKTLDPHSSYTDAEETREVTEPLQGNFSGIGIQFRMVNDTLNVIQTIAGGPSEKAGIVAGDRIITANDTAISGAKMPNSQVMKHLRGPKGTIVQLGVLRHGSSEPVIFNIKRDDIPLYSVDAAFMAAPGVGYVKVSRFAESTAAEVRDALRKLRAQGMKDIVIDLQDNGGGYLQSAIEMAEMFLPENSPVVYTEGMRARPSSYTTSRSGEFEKERLVVLINQFSASASEIFAGAVQDNDRGVIVGRRSFGKGLVQRPIPFPDGSMIRLTVARYHTPSGRCIQKPYQMGEEEDYARDILRRYEAGEFMSADSIHLPDSLRYTTLRLKRTVYGGGGIMPDHFVPIDTTGYNLYARDVVAKGIISSFATTYVNNHRKEIKRQYPTAELFVARFEVTPEMMEQFVTAAEEGGVKRDDAQIEESRNYLTTILKALIASDLYDHSAYFLVAKQLDNTYLRALQLLP